MFCTNIRFIAFHHLHFLNHHYHHNVIINITITINVTITATTIINSKT